MGVNDSFCTDTCPTLDVKPCRGYARREHPAGRRTRILLDRRDHALPLYLALDIADATRGIDPVRKAFPISTMHLYTLSERMSVLCIERYGVATITVFKEARHPLVHETRQHGLRQAAQFGVGQ